MRCFEEIEHTADRAFHVKGRDLAALLENAALAMHALEGMRFTAKATATREIELEAVDRESLLVNWLKRNPVLGTGVPFGLFAFSGLRA